MKPAPLPENENARLKALHSYDVLDTLPQEEFDALTRLASYICEVPIALISLVDEKRQWFKSRVGLDAEETPRNISFCQHAILDDSLFEIEDATTDDRLADSPLVQGDPTVRFYAGAPLVNPDGHRLGTLCVIDSVPKRLSERQKEALDSLAEEVVQLLELRRRTAALEAANERLSKFAHVAAHDLKAPLRAVATVASFAEEELAKGETEEVEQYLELIRSRTERMQGLIDGLLEYARIGPTAGEVRAVDPEPIIHRVIESIDVPADFAIEVQSAMPAVLVGELHFECLMLNLISNAVKHSDSSGGSVAVRHESDGSMVVFTVEDDGPGIDSKYHDRIFEVFQTLEARDTKESTGIGLAIVKRIVEEAGGEVWVESTPGSGASFRFSVFAAD